MIRLRISSFLLAIAITVAASSSIAKWETVKDPFGAKRWRVKNTETGQTISNDYDSKKKAKKAAKILNKADKSVMPGPNGEGDFRGGGQLP